MALIDDTTAWVVDREAIASILVEHLRQSLTADHDAALTEREINSIVERYRDSDALRQAVDAEVERLEAHLTGRIH